MKTKSVLSRLEKAGLIAQQDRTGKYWVAANGRVVSWRDQNGNVHRLHSCRDDDHNDIGTDYFAGYYTHSLSSAMRDLGIKK